MFIEKILTLTADQFKGDAKTNKGNHKHALSTHIDYKKRIKLVRNETNV